MADSKISALTELTTVLVSHELPINDSTPTTKRASVDNILKGCLDFAHLYAATAITTQTVSSGTPEKLLAFDTAGATQGMTAVAGGTCTITPTQTGIYLVLASISFSGSASATWDLEIRFNDAVTGFHAHRKLSASGDLGNMGFFGLVDVTANNTITLWGEPDGAAKDIVVQSGHLVAIRLGAT
jgi:hypothetical protein